MTFYAPPFSGIISQPVSGREEKSSEVSKMPEEQKRQAEKISAEMNKLTPEAREKVLIFVQGMTAMLDTPKKQPKEAV